MVAVRVAVKQTQLGRQVFLNKALQVATDSPTIRQAETLILAVVVVAQVQLVAIILV